jgi:aminoglycoside phosphotransferase family enzyme/predicted kinase
MHQPCVEPDPDPEAGLGLQAQRRAVSGLCQALGAQLIETHISFVLLAGGFAYKLKKALNLGFVDFTTLARRRFYCDEELRLNRRTAPDLYLDVLPLTGTPERPQLGGRGAAIDWVLRMRAFPQDGLWDRLAAMGSLRAAHIDAGVEALCALHRQAAVAAADDPVGQAGQVRVPLRDSLLALQSMCRAEDERAELAWLQQWEASTFDALRPAFEQRQRDGRVRECHGDLHLGNVTQFEGRTTLFDCLEFSAALRWTDVMSDLAFMAMDLRAHALPRLSQRFVNACLECSGDWAGLRVLRYYLVHRALVRAKVAALRGAQLAHGDAQRTHASRTLRHYLEVALAYTRPAAPALMITHGFSGSGKTLLTQSLLELCGAVRLRADVERKRLFGLDARARSDAALKPQLYADAATQATHARLHEAAAWAVQDGFSVILDATFLSRAQRQQAAAFAARLGVRFAVIHFEASVPTLRERVRCRALRGDDASEADLAVLEQQLAHAQPLADEEREAVYVFDAEAAFDEAAMPMRWAPLLRRLGLSEG